MKKYEYKTDVFTANDEKELAAMLSQAGRVGWRCVQTREFIPYTYSVLLEREIEADSEYEYDIIPSVGLCYIESRGVIKDCCFYKSTCPDWALRRCEVDDVIFVRKGGDQ